MWAETKREVISHAHSNIVIFDFFNVCSSTLNKNMIKYFMSKLLDQGFKEIDCYHIYHAKSQTFACLWLTKPEMNEQ